MCQVILADVFAQEPADELLAQYACATEQAGRLLIAAFRCLQSSLMSLTVV